MSTTCAPVIINSSSPPIPALTPPLSRTPPSHPPEVAESPSTPPRCVSGEAGVAPHSSPGLPSPSFLLRAKKPGPILAIGSRAQPAPKGVKLGFVSAASLAREEAPPEQDNALQHAPVKGVRKRATKKATIAEAGFESDSKELKKKERKRRGDTTEDTPKRNQTIKPRKISEKQDAVEPGRSTDSVKKVRKQPTKTTRAGKDTPVKEAGQGMKSAQKQTKRKPKDHGDEASAAKPTKQPEERASTALPSTELKKSSAKPADTGCSEKSAYFVPTAAAIETPRNIAGARRRSWTPVKDTGDSNLESENLAMPLNDEPDAENPPNRVPLSELLVNFAYVGCGPKPPASDRAPFGEATIKRRRIELDDGLINIPSNLGVPTGAQNKSATTKAVKAAKAPKRKAQTITALATAAYQINKEPEAEATITPYVVGQVPQTEHKDSETEKVANESVAKVTKPRKPRTKASGQVGESGVKKSRARKTKATTKEAEYAPRLFSPARAFQKMQQQDFLFGTSSQLAAPESPTFIREMQWAQWESEALQSSQVGFRVPSAPHGTCLSVGQGNRQLWRSAARDFKGGLHRDTSGLLKRPMATSSKASIDKPGLNPSIPEKTISPTNAVDETPAPPIDLVEKPLSGTSATTGWVDIDAMPSVTSKPQDQADLTNSENFREETVTVNQEQTWTHIDEISDDEPSPTPSPPRRRANAPPVVNRTLTLSQTNEQTVAPSSTTSVLATTAMLKATDAQWTERLPVLFSQITSTIKSAPPSTSLTTPSWHEKILLYDPIVLEDLTIWLNDQGIRVRVERYKRKGPVKGRKKKLDATNGDALNVGEHAEIEALDEPLQPWMVQKWCEDKSVCCLWKDGLRGGVKTKY